MAINSYFFIAVMSGGVYDRVYNAADFTSYLDMLVGNGVFPTPSTQLQVRASTGMNVIVGAGSGWINGHKLVNTADMTLAVESSDVLLGRIDAVIFYVDLDSRSMGIEIKTGDLSASPVAPALVRTSDRYEMCLAHIRVDKQVDTIVNAMITDTRGNSDLCGYVQGLIQQLDTATLFQQWQDAFDTWFSAVQEQLRTGLALRKYEGVYIVQNDGEDRVYVKRFVPQFAYAYDILEVYVDGIHMNTNEYMLHNNTITFNSGLSADQVVTMVVFHMVDSE